MFGIRVSNKFVQIQPLAVHAVEVVVLAVRQHHHHTTMGARVALVKRKFLDASAHLLDNANLLCKL